MMPQADKQSPGTVIHIPPSTNEDQVLSRLNKNFRLSKAQQILRLLKDQDTLNQRFRDCDLLDEDDDEDAKSMERRPQDVILVPQDDDEDAWSLQDEHQSEAGDSDLSENETERQAARLMVLRKHCHSIDLGRCKTSMGFHNHAEVTEIPYNFHSNNMAGIDSACSTPRGVAAGATSSNQPDKETLHGQANPSKSGNNSQVKMHHQNIGDSDACVRELCIPEDHLVQSARSSRPKTSLTSFSSTQNHYYRQQPHPEAHHNLYAHQNHYSLTRQHPELRGVGETRQAIISRLGPHHPMGVRSFCESRAAQEEAARMGVQHPSSQPTIPRSSGRHQANTPHFSQTAVTLFGMASSFSKDAPVRSTSRRSMGTGSHGANLARSTSFMEHQQMVPANRTLLSVDSSPIHLGEVSPRTRVLTEDPGNSRCSRLMRVKKRVGEMPSGPLATSMQVLSDRAHPSMTVMKLPPLEAAVNKGGAGRDLVCVGKD